MRTRFKGPTGTGVLEIGDDATLRLIFEQLRARTGIQSFKIKYGPPMAMNTVTIEHADLEARSLGLHGETVTIVPDDDDSPTTSSLAAEQWEMPGKASTVDMKAADGKRPEDVIVSWPQREGILLLRVMPSDNSCLFTAFGGALPEQLPASKLREMMADYIDEHSDVYNDAILGSSREEYRRSIQDPDRWGGGIELSILSTIFDIQICTFDVQTTKIMNFGEMKQSRCILLYSGIHYDRVAFSYTDSPHDTATLPPEMDRTIWPTDDLEVLEKAQELVNKLNACHYYTDTEGLILKCNEPRCDWIGSGQAEAKAHAERTGHFNLSEVNDVETDNVLRRCEVAGCTFMGQGDKAMHCHRADTGHGEYSIIPDI